MMPGQVEYGGKCSVLERDDERVDAALQWPVMSPEAARAQEGANAAAAAPPIIAYCDPPPPSTICRLDPDLIT